jgi:hypothetical protein
MRILSSYTCTDPHIRPPKIGGSRESGFRSTLPKAHGNLFRRLERRRVYSFGAHPTAPSRRGSAARSCSPYPHGVRLRGKCSGEHRHHLWAPWLPSADTQLHGYAHALAPAATRGSAQVLLVPSCGEGLFALPLLNHCQESRSAHLRCAPVPPPFDCDACMRALSCC